MANTLYSILPGMVEDFYAEFLDGDRSEELFMEFANLKELHWRIKDKLAAKKIAQDGIADATTFVNRMDEIVPAILPDEEKYLQLKAFW